MSLRVQRRTDGLWLASVSPFVASWRREEHHALVFTQDELNRIQKWTTDCDFIEQQPLNFLEYYHVS